MSPRAGRCRRAHFARRAAGAAFAIGPGCTVAHTNKRSPYPKSTSLAGRGKLRSTEIQELAHPCFFTCVVPANSAAPMRAGRRRLVEGRAQPGSPGGCAALRPSSERDGRPKGAAAGGRAASGGAARGGELQCLRRRLARAVGTCGCAQPTRGFGSNGAERRGKAKGAKLPAGTQPKKRDEWSKLGARAAARSAAAAARRPRRSGRLPGTGQVGGRAARRGVAGTGRHSSLAGPLRLSVARLPTAALPLAKPGP
jgi:hypothetical protein